MLKIMIKLCKPCLVIGFGMYLVSTIALANNEGAVSYEYILTAVLGAFVLVIGAYVKGSKDSLQGQITENKDEINYLYTYINANHVTRNELSYVLQSDIRPLQIELQNIKNVLKMRD